MKDSDLARLFEAMQGQGERLERKTLKKYARVVVFSEAGLALIKHFSPCLQTRVNAFTGVSGLEMAFTEGRRSLLRELINMATDNRENDDG